MRTYDAGYPARRYRSICPGSLWAPVAPHNYIIRRTDDQSMKRIVLFFLCIMLFLMVSGCSQPQAQQAQPTPSPVATTAPPVITSTPLPRPTMPSVSDNKISIKNMAFNPPSLTVKAGLIVRWVNNDEFPHTVTFTKESGIDASGPLSSSQSFSVKFDQPGTFAYSCAIHPGMHGTVVVE